MHNRFLIVPYWKQRSLVHPPSKKNLWLDPFRGPVSTMPASTHTSHFGWSWTRTDGVPLSAAITLQEDWRQTTSLSGPADSGVSMLIRQGARLWRSNPGWSPTHPGRGQTTALRIKLDSNRSAIWSGRLGNRNLQKAVRWQHKVSLRWQGG